MRAVYLLLCILAFNIFVNAQDITPWPDSVASYNFGTGTTFGQSDEYFPNNVLGMPDTSARYNTASAVPEEICALGLGGEIVLRFIDNTIVNGEGADFTIFENAFEIQFGPRAGEIFAEPAKVAVSYDGITYYEFPFDSTTLVGCAGTYPTNGNQDLFNPDSSGGNSFNLDDVEIDTVKYIKITDISSIVRTDPNHPFFDVTANGFDLDAVLALNQIDPLTPIEEEIEYHQNRDEITASVSPNPASLAMGGNIKVTVNVPASGNYKAALYNILGEKVKEYGMGYLSQGNTTVSINKSELTSGMYIFNITGAGKLSKSIKVLAVK